MVSGASPQRLSGWCCREESRRIQAARGPRPPLARDRPAAPTAVRSARALPQRFGPGFRSALSRRETLALRSFFGYPSSGPIRESAPWGVNSRGRTRSSAMPLTKRQREILNYLTAYSEQNGFAPSFEEIAENFDYNSLATVHEHLTNLERKGYIKRSYNESRAIEILPSEASPRAVELPLLGS